MAARRGPAQLGDELDELLADALIGAEDDDRPQPIQIVPAGPWVCEVDRDGGYRHEPIVVLALVEYSDGEREVVGYRAPGDLVPVEELVDSRTLECACIGEPEWRHER